MIRDEYKEGNELIARYAGEGYYQAWRKGAYKALWSDRFHSKKTCDDCIAKSKMSGELEAVFIAPDYHKDPLRLMRIVDKIGKEFPVSITWSADMEVAYIDRPDMTHETEHIADFGGYGWVLNTWHAVVKFIKWFNKKYYDDI